MIIIIIVSIYSQNIITQNVKIKLFIKITIQYRPVYENASNN